jgi:hypothetical protein
LLIWNRRWELNCHLICYPRHAPAVQFVSNLVVRKSGSSEFIA